MQTIITLNIFVVILAYFSKYRKTRFLYEMSFVVIFLFTAFRYDYGTDYSNYEEYFNQISSYQTLNLIDYNRFNFELAWVFLNFLFKPIGFYGFIIVLSAFICYTYYSIIKRYVDPRYLWMAVFLYVFSVDVMWIQFSAIRQAFSIAIFIHSVKYLNEKRNPLVFVLINLFGGLFHSSAYLMIPLVVFSFENLKKSKMTGFFILVLFWGLMFFGDVYITQIVRLTSLFSGDRYANVFDYKVDSSTTFIGSIAWGTLLFIVIFYSKFQHINIRNLFYLTSLHSLVYVLGPLIWLADRMGYYFAAFSIVVYPLIIKYEKRRLIKFCVFAVYVTFLFYRMINFFKLDWVIDGYSKYQTILSNLF